jgi:hypothetical protein
LLHTLSSSLTMKQPLGLRLGLREPTRFYRHTTRSGPEGATPSRQLPSASPEPVQVVEALLERAVEVEDELSALRGALEDLEVPELTEILEDEPDWKDVLRVEPIELDERHVSAN